MPFRRRRFKRLFQDVCLFFARDCEREAVELVFNSVHCLAKRVGRERAAEVILDAYLGKDFKDE
jgi:hypothetical protein